MIAEVIIDVAHSDVDRVFDYKIDLSGALLGSRVEVPFGNRRVEGFVVHIKENTDVPPTKIKSIIRQIDEFPVISEEHLKLANFIKDRYHVPFALALRLFIPSEMRGGRVKSKIVKYCEIQPFSHFTKSCLKARDFFNSRTGHHSAIPQMA